MTIEIEILYEDEWLLAASKPPGLPVHATLDTRREHLLGLLAARVPGPLVLVHRLDVDTSGVVLLSRRPEANAPLSQAFAERTTDKRYLALTARPTTLPEPTWQVRNHLSDKKKNGPPVVAVRAGGQQAWTEFTLRQAGLKALLVEARLHTGRRHQIRVHLADAGLPILGDADYGPEVLHRAPRVMLHAWHLGLPHPHDSRWLALTCPPPADFRAVAAREGLALPENP